MGLTAGIRVRAEIIFAICLLPSRTGMSPSACRPVESRVETESLHEQPRQAWDPSAGTAWGEHVVSAALGSQDSAAWCSIAVLLPVGSCFGEHRRVPRQPSPASSCSLHPDSRADGSIEPAGGLSGKPLVRILTLAK
ncbi:hypothetical protein BDU57DRAFT_225333 [Ampelomyces quisqualis]|uniref:Uncharacterized protein n=1 Tax=Ampelomyces quisqualis TaxID=50730 RepID=A0A6A5QL08_AMPQU|nr:hypothetical protein BDU57DRAFT_225333 [Ampelomyces quisqualis]